MRTTGSRPDGRRRRRVGPLAAVLALLAAAQLAVAGGADAAVAGHNPVGTLQTATISLGAVRLTGWTIDPDTPAPTTVTVTVDGKNRTTVTANIARGAVKQAYPHYGAKHGFSASVPLTDGTHQVCVIARNAAHTAGTKTTLGCRSLTGVNDPTGALETATRTTTGITVTGWAVDPDTASPVSVGLTLDGAAAATVVADDDSPAAGTSYPGVGGSHGFTVTIPATADAHTVCATLTNLGLGRNTTTNCITVPAGTVPAAPASVGGYTTPTGLTVTWAAPADNGGSAVTGYTVTLSNAVAGSTPVTLTEPATMLSATFTGLTASTTYTASVSATNDLGTGTAAAATLATQKYPNISTSHYLRNLTNVATTDNAALSAMGAADAAANPAGHPYLVLMDLGGQTTNGVMLSATTKVISYPDLVGSLEAYLAGYASNQQTNAPMTLAIGTNNDLDVDQSHGAVWANQLVNPVAEYAATSYPNITVAAANDIEPGFSATYAETKAWLAGYLNNSTVPFVFNGSADGCSTTTASTRCNNGWTTTGLNWLAGGAAPTRILVLPQIYNTTMPKQWATISAIGSTPLRFAGPLTELRACQQAGSCSSATNNTAWTNLFAATGAIDLPYGTDLKIN